jgi:aspartyl-tRNA(Asn)/glutamyl-tRNA(Gln) amidotransferase subunit B
VEGKVVEAITLGYDEHADRLRKQREKETEEEYRYFHEPDLPEVLVSDEWSHTVLESLPELPVPRARRLMEQYGLPPDVAGIITYEQAVADYFEEAATGYQDRPWEIANWIRNDILSLFSDYREILKVRERLSPAHLRELIELVDANVINRNTAKTILPEIAPDKGPKQIVEEKGLQQVSDTGELETICQKVLAANLDSVESYRSGKDGALNFLMGQVMRETKGKADPGVVRGLLKDLIDRM